MCGEENSRLRNLTERQLIAHLCELFAQIDINGDGSVIASSDLQFRFYDDINLRLVKSCHTPTSQNCLKMNPDSSTLFSAGVSGIVYAWDAERMEERHHMGGEARGKVLLRSHDDIVLDLLNVRSCSLWWAFLF